MKFRFIFIGRTREKYLARGIEDFLTRIGRYYSAEEVVIKGVKASDRKAEAVRAQDTQSLLAKIRPDDYFVHLDPEGKQMSSLELSSQLESKINSGVKSMVFGLGGPLGLTSEAAARANLRLCLSRLTLTHEMCRLVLLEQIYRSLRVIAGHPYHK